MGLIKPDPLSICDLFRSAPRYFPSIVAVENGHEKISYRELDTASSVFAARLLRKGVRPGQPIPILTSLCIPMVVGILGILKAGGVYVPIDRYQWSEHRINGVLDEIGECFLIYTGESYSREGFEALPVEFADVKEYLAAECEQPEAFPARRPNDLCYIIFTSGTSGKPKGVMVNHMSLMNLVTSRPFNMDATFEDRILLSLSVAFDACTSTLFSALCNAATVVLADPTTLHERVSTCSIIVLTPPILRSLQPPPQLPSIRAGKKTRLHTIILGGDSTSHELLKSWSLPGRTLYNVYGPTEATCSVLTAPFEISDETKEYKTTMLGHPIHGCSVELLDEDRHEIADMHVEGEIALGGIVLADGYWKDEKRTQERMVPWKGFRVYLTGDYARWTLDNSGRKCLEYRGRRDRQVKNRGFLINLGADVDTSILRISPSVVASHSAMYDGNLYSVVAPRTANTAAIREEMTAQLSKYMVPDRIIAVEQLPLSTSGKIDPHGVQRLIAEFVTSTDLSISEQRDSRGVVLQGISGLLRLPLEEIDQSLSFMAMGGHSLLALALKSHCLQRGIQISMGDIMGKSIGEISLLSNAGSVEEIAAPQADESFLGYSNESPDVAEVGPATSLQTSLIYGSQKVLGRNFIHCYFTLPTESLPTLRNAWRQVVEAEPLFRTKFHFDGSKMLQIVQRQGSIEWKEIVVDTEDAFQNQLRKFDGYKSDVNTAFKVVSRCDQPNVCTLKWTVHHALIDGYSMTIILDRVHRAATGLVVDSSPSFASLARLMEYGLQYSAEQRDTNVENFWQVQEDLIAHSSSELLLPSPQLGNVSCGAVAEPSSIVINVAQGINDVEAYARRLSVTPATFFYAAWAMLLSTYADSQEVVFGVVVSQRDYPISWVQNVVGPLICMLPLQISLDPAQPVGDFLKFVFSRLHDVSRHQWSYQSGKDRQFVSAMAMQYSAPSETCDILSPLKKPYYEESAVLPLSISVEEDSSVRFLYDRACFDDRQIQCLAEGYRNVWQALFQNYNTVGICLQKSLTDGAIQDLLNKGNCFSPSTRNSSVSENLTTLFERSASLYGDLISVEKNSQTITYRTLNELATRLALRLSHIIEQGEIVCLHADQSINWIIGIFAILKAGGVYFPLDEQHPRRYRDALFEQSGARLFLAPEVAQLRHMPVSSLMCVAIDQVVSQQEEGPPRRLPGRTFDSEANAYLCFTSGSTGKPKGVLCKHRGLVAFQRDLEVRLMSGPGCRISQLLSVGFDGCIHEVFSALCYGSTLVLPKSKSDRFGHLSQVDSAILTPSFAEGFDPVECPKLKNLYLVGEPVPQKVVERWAPSRSVYNMYGPTEGTGGATIKKLSPNESVTIGTPNPSTRIYILNSRHELAPPGAVGEIYVAGVQVASGYLGMEAETRQHFLPDSICKSLGEQMYKTGDMGYWNERGEIVCLGRKDRQVKLRGYRLNLDDIELRIAREMSEISAVAVTTSNGALVAWVQPSSLDLSILERTLSTVLPRQARPKLLAVDKFPKTKCGKLDYKYIANHTKPKASHGEKTMTALTSSQLIIAKAWHDVLMLDECAVIRAEDSFVDLGGHSILQLRLAANLSKALNVTVPLCCIIESSNLRELGLAVDTLARQETEIESMPELEPKLEEHDLSPVEIDWYHKYQSATCTTAFNVPFVCQLDSSVDRHRLANAWNVVLSRHIMLRSRFIISDGRIQRTYSQSPPTVNEVEAADVWQLINRPFHVDSDHLVSVTISRNRLVVVISHLICDLTTLQILQREVLAGYLRLELPKLGKKYTESAAWRRRADPNTLDFWSTYLSGVPTQKKLNQTAQEALHQGTTRVLEVSNALYNGMRDTAKKYAVTLHQFALAAVAISLNPGVQEVDIVLGAPFRNRDATEDMDIVGLFLEPLPVRLRFDDSQSSTKAILQSVRSSSQSALGHTVPWHKLLDHLKLDRLAHQPLFNSVVTLHERQASDDAAALNMEGAKPLFVWAEGSKFDLLVEFTILDSGRLIARVEYNTCRYSAVEMRMFESRLLTTIAGLIDNVPYADIRRQIEVVSQVDWRHGEPMARRGAFFGTEY